MGVKVDPEVDSIEVDRCRREQGCGRAQSPALNKPCGRRYTRGDGEGESVMKPDPRAQAGR